MIALLMIFLLIALIVCRVPVAFTIIFTGFVGLLAIMEPGAVFGVLMVAPADAVQSFSLSAIPLFIFMAHLMLQSGLVDKLFAAAQALLGRTPGGTGVASTVAGVAFAAVSGSSTASAATLAQTTSVKMIEEGYKPTTATGIVASVGTLAGMIPPSIILVFYAITAEANVGDMIIAGFVPGLIIAAALLLTMYITMLRDPEAMPKGQRVGWMDKIRQSKGAIPIVLIFGAVIGGIYFGVATPTEAAAIGCLSAFVLLLLSGKMTVQGLLGAVIETVKSSSMIFAIIIGAFIFGHFITETGVTDEIVGWVESLGVHPLVIMFFITAFYVVLGFFMDQAAIVALTVPIMLPVVETLGYDAIWFGIFVVLMGEIGLISPPLGLNVFIVAKTAKRPTEEVFRGAVPYIISMIAVAILFILFPGIVTWLPNTM